jgi:hypothetical protein
MLAPYSFGMFNNGLRIHTPGSILDKSNTPPIAIISCAVFQHLFEEMLPDELQAEATFLDYGLHVVPNNLRATVQATIDAIPTPSRVVLGYGLCGNGLRDIHARDHTLLIPRADDCIAILLGSYQAYMAEFNANPGTYYLTKGWLESGSDPLREQQKLVEKYGEETGNWIMDQQYRHYKRLVLVGTSEADLAAYRPRAIAVAEYCARWGMVYEEILGSNEYFRKLMAAIPFQTETDEDFLVILPGEVIPQNDFLRL